MLNVIIVDDEPLALDVLENYIGKVSSLNLRARCSHALEANEALRDGSVDLMFLDIQMPQLSGIDFIRTLSNPPMIALTTAFQEYALDGFDLNVLDYLVKPVAFDRFLKTVNKAQEQFLLRKHANEQSGAADFMFVKADKKLIKINFDEVLYIEGLKDYVIIRMTGQRVVTLQTMKSLEETLPRHQFRRVHRSYIVSLSKVAAVDGTTVEIQEKDKLKLIPIGKNYRDQLQDLIEQRRL